jgi:hypothetical protein
MKNKKCKGCEIIKPLTEFSVAKENKDGFNNTCKKCKCKYAKLYTEKNKFKVLKRRKELYKKPLQPEKYIRLENKICSVCSENKPIDSFNKNNFKKDGYRPECKVCQSKKAREYRLKNGDKLKKYRIENKDKINTYKKNKKENDINYKITCNLRTRLWSAIKNNYKNGSAVDDLGCSIEYFKVYIESRFENGMTWDNWGRDTWHLDHIEPLSSFNLSNREEFLKAVNYKNIKPIWAKDNLTKGGIKKIHAKLPL